MDELDVFALKGPLSLLNIYDLFVRYGQDVNSITSEEQLKTVGAIERLRGVLD